MGVDKADVRTVITGYIPESISRFYQEVGRAGRDGFSSLNYFVFFEDVDIKGVRNLTKSSVLTQRSIATRWKNMYKESTKVSADKIIVDISTPPDHLKFEIVGGKNKAWNNVVVLNLLRAGLIRIEDVRINGFEEYSLVISIISENTLRNTEKLEEFIKPYRDRDRNNINDGVANITRLLHNYTSTCLSEFFTSEFKYAFKRCSGCPKCRSKIQSNQQSELEIQLNNYGGKIVSMNNSIYDYYDYYFKSGGNILIKIDNEKDDTILKQIELLVSHNINIVIAPSKYQNTELLELLSLNNIMGYMILTLDEAKKIGENLIDGRIALIYSNEIQYNSKLYNFSKRIQNGKNGISLIHITGVPIYDNEEQKYLDEIVDSSFNIKEER